MLKVDADHYLQQVSKEADLLCSLEACKLQTEKQDKQVVNKSEPTKTRQASV